MKETSRNLLVGLTVLVGLVLLAALVITFRELPGFMQVGYGVRILFDDSAGLQPGADVICAGQRIGHVTAVDFIDADPRKGIVVDAVIDRGVKVPGDVNAYIRARGLAGGAMIELRSDGRSPGADRKIAWIPTDRVLTLEKAPALPASGLIPAELTADIREAMGSMKTLADRLNGFLAPPTATASAPASGPARRANFHRTLARLDDALGHVNEVFGDPTNQANFKAGLNNFKTAADAAAQAMEQIKTLVAAAKKTLADVSVVAKTGSKTFADVSTAAKGSAKRFDELAAKLIVNADQLGRAVTIFNRIAAKMESGDGTAGKLINDPALYNALLGATRQLKISLARLQEVLEQWKEHGVKMHLK